MSSTVPCRRCRYPRPQLRRMVADGTDMHLGLIAEFEILCQQCRLDAQIENASAGNRRTQGGIPHE